MKKNWINPEVKNLGLEETKSDLHYHCGQCGKVVPANEIDNKTDAQLDAWTCSSCGSSYFSIPCIEDHDEAGGDIVSGS